MIGWPRAVAYKNPSQMSVDDMGTILSLLESRTIFFQRIPTTMAGPQGTVSQPQASGVSSPLVGGDATDEDIDTDLSWACNDDVFYDITPQTDLPVPLCTTERSPDSNSLSSFTGASLRTSFPAVTDDDDNRAPGVGACLLESSSLALHQGLKSPSPFVTSNSVGSYHPASPPTKRARLNG